MFHLEQERFEMKLKSFKERLDHLVITQRCFETAEDLLDEDNFFSQRKTFIWEEKSLEDLWIALW